MTETRFQVISRYVPVMPPGQEPPGTHYQVRDSEPDKRIARAFRHYSFYRTSAGQEMCSFVGYEPNGTRPYSPVHGELFEAIRAAVVAYDREHGRSCLKCGKDLSGEMGVYIFADGKPVPGLLCVEHGANGKNGMSREEYERLTGRK